MEILSLNQTWNAQELERIIQATGIQRVRLAGPEITTADLCADAADRLIQRLDVARDTLDAIVFVSQTPDYKLPPTSALLQNRLKLKADVLAFDLNWGCSGYIYGLLQAAVLCASGICNKVLVCAGDTTSKLISPKDRSVRVVFGDAGSATIIEKVPGGQIAFAVKTDGAGAPSLIVPAGGCRTPSTTLTSVEVEAEENNFRSAEHLFMDGVAVMNFALRVVPSIIDDVLSLAPWQKAETSLYMLHQANGFIVDYLRRKMRLDKEAVPFACRDIGNTGPASIPLALTLEAERLQQQSRLQKVVLCGFGVGLSWGAAAVDLSKTQFVGLGEI